MKVTPSLSFALALCAVAVPAQAALVAYYTFDGDDAADTSGNGNNGSIGSTTTPSIDVPAAIGTGKSMVGDGSNNSIITVANSPSLQSITHNLTVSFWIKAATTDNPNWVRMMRKGDEEGNNGSPAWMINRNSNSSNSYIRIDSEPAGFNQNRGSGGAVFTGDWVHLAYTLDAGAFTEYINGSQSASGTYADSSLSNTGALTILGRAGGVLDGMMDDVAIWNETLNASQIAQLSNGASALSIIPEPSSAALLLFGAAAMFRRRR